MSSWLEERNVLEKVTRLLQKRATTMKEICGRTRVQRIAQARQDVWLYLVEDHHFSSNELAFIFQRDPSTVSYGVREAMLRRLEVS